MENDYLRDSGIKTLGTRIRRLFERLNSNVTEVYRRELGFEQRWFALGMLLKDHGPMNSRDATKRLGQSHVAMVQVVRAMEKSGLLERQADPSDARSKILHLTSAGAEKLEQVSAISRLVDQAATELLAEAAPDFLHQLDALDDALDRLSFADRIEIAFSEGGSNT
ncbi:MarR family transcriptional regulator [Sphingorhabdus sp. Alg231-15]|uniref:MarR family transcriptional regulator n=1 Tax=Sphingorhabdus sp. Alg231-15 TaxID=1922222 RepID=UPI000D54AF6D